ncbi:serine/threonine-protein kinase [Nocardioides fonticola]|uniref:non-specific serine/threonine protein kinase n=1 Tax=Nocardioides fonticola TaxID=450363 RepID=A0ABP7XKQ7_9ACTN
MPQRLGRYAVRRRIGAGGFATVWLAYDDHLDSPVAVKVLADNWTEDSHVRRRFIEEGRYLRRVESPHVVSVYDAGELDDGRPYLVMSYADQGTLADRLETEGLTPGQALEVIRQVGMGLQALHDLDILHRDIKPANVLFRTRKGTVQAMVGDLGLGKALDMSSRLTMIAGTPSYVAPEQARAQSPDARADQYSLAALSYLLLTGRPPYAHASLQQAAHPDPPPPVSTPDRVFPDAVEQVLVRGLAVDREERFPDVTAFVDALDEALGRPAPLAPGKPWLPIDPELTQPGKRPSPQPVAAADLDAAATTLPRPRRRVLRAVVAVAASLVVLGGTTAGGYALQRSRLSPTVTVTDASGALSVAVPRGWDAAVARGPWGGPTRPDADGDLPALSVGTSAAWAEAGQGVFLGLFSGTALPQLMPGHPECDTTEPEVRVEQPGTPSSTTVVHTGCPDGVTVERVVRLGADTLLWVQVRATDADTAEQVLDTVSARTL